jgi:hypothetical protein
MLRGLHHTPASMTLCLIDACFLKWQCSIRRDCIPLKVQKARSRHTSHVTRILKSKFEIVFPLVTHSRTDCFLVPTHRLALSTSALTSSFYNELYVIDWISNSHLGSIVIDNKRSYFLSSYYIQLLTILIDGHSVFG